MPLGDPRSIHVESMSSGNNYRGLVTADVGVEEDAAKKFVNTRSARPLQRRHQEAAL